MLVTLLGVLGSVVGLYLLVLSAVVWLTLRPPRIPLALTPGILGVTAESVEITAEDGMSTKGWWVEGEGAGVVVLVHGYIMNRCEFVPLVPLIHSLGYSCLLFDLRGHGGAGKGSVTFGVREQAEVRAGIALARSRQPQARIVGFGSSMGAAALAMAIEGEPKLVDAFVADSMYRSLREAAAGWWSFFTLPWCAPLLRPVNEIAARLTGIDPSTVETLGGLRAMSGRPVLLFFGGLDPLIPADARAALSEAAGPGSETVVFAAGSHGDGRLKEPEAFRATLSRFLTCTIDGEA